MICNLSGVAFLVVQKKGVTFLKVAQEGSYDAVMVESSDPKGNSITITTKDSCI
ncbi:hypothetical protein Hanom_Chr09g00862011 [Helianthus anomalus]